MMNKKTGLIALLASFAVGELYAGTLTNYAVGDVLICFRKGGTDLVVDAGPLSGLTNAVPNQRITISQYTGAQVGAVGLDAMSWSAFTWQADNTLYVTRARSSIGAQTTAWQRKSAGVQQGSALRMATIPPGAVDEMGYSGLNTETAVIEEDVSSGNPNYAHGVSYHEALAGAFGGAFNGTFVGNPENTTLASFTTSGQVVRSDFYELAPGAGNGRLLGYFELDTTGVMTYVAYPSAVPVFKTISRSGTDSTITYTTGLYGTYTLRGTNGPVAGAPRASWPAISTLTSGDSATHSITFTDTDSARFYTITAQ